MATRRKKAAPETAPVETVVEVKLPGNLVFGCSRPNQKSWDRYLHKLSRGEELVARREVIQSNSATHPVEGARKILDRFPAVITGLSNGLDSVLGGDLEPATDEEEGLVSFDLGGASFVMNGPDLNKWEAFQGDLSDPKKRIGPTMREFVAKLCDNPGELASALEKYPAAIGPIVAAVGNIAGAGFEVVVKKG